MTAVALRAISSAAIGPLHRLGERSLLLKGTRVRRPIFRALERLSRDRASAAREAFERASPRPSYLSAARLQQMIIARGARRARIDRPPPRDRAEQRAAEVLLNIGPYLPPRASVLDLACGDGMVAAAIKEHGIAAAVSAVDRSDEHFSPAARAVRFFRADASSTEFDDNSFDAVYSFNSFEHFADPAAVLREVHRILKPGGVLYTTFGPLYYSPFGAHQRRVIDLPYCHLLFRQDDLSAAASQLGRGPLTRELNFWSLARFRELFCAQADRFATLHRFEKFNTSFVDLIRSYPACFRSKVHDFDELIVQSIEVLLRKR